MRKLRRHCPLPIRCYIANKLMRLGPALTGFAVELAPEQIKLAE
jgi:hypothetical protein